MTRSPKSGPLPTMGPIEALRVSLAKSLDYRGRARRKEFWWLMAWTTFLPIPFSLLDALLFDFRIHDIPVGPLGTLVSLALFIPCLSSSIRRMHDVGRGSSCLVKPLAFSLLSVVALRLATPFLVPYLPQKVLVGSIFLIGIAAPLSVLGVLVKWHCEDGQPFPNTYGPDPKGRDTLARQN